jgi:hypothetical protein
MAIRSSWTTCQPINANVRLAIEAAEATLCYLPPYSPDFNPIENAFSKLTAFLRKAAARSSDALWNAIRDALDVFTPQGCANYCTATGHDRLIGNCSNDYSIIPICAIFEKTGVDQMWRRT